MLGPEDPPGPTIIVDVLFYSILAWVVWYGIQFFRRQAFPVKHFRASLMLNVFLGVCLWVFYLIFTFTLGFQVIGRGHRDSVDVETPRGIHSAMAFAPSVSIPLDEVIEYYGVPDTVWFTSGSSTQGRATGMMLYWDAVPVYVELPPIAEEAYPVHRMTAIERIIFYDGQDVMAVAGQTISEEKTIWTGYGNYRP